MERAIITISESGKVNISSINVWMFEMELVELFGVIVSTLRAAIKTIYKNCGLSTLRAAIKTIYKNCGLCPTSTQRYSSVTPKS